MATIEMRQRALVEQFTGPIVDALQGVAAIEHAAGRGRKFGTLCSGNEPTRPLAVTLEPRRDGLFLGLVVSRPRGGKFMYGNTLGCWDFTAPIASGGRLDAANPLHRRAAFWACNMAEELLVYARTRLGAPRLHRPPAATIWPRVLVPFYNGTEQIDAAKQAANPAALIDRNSMPGMTLVDAAIANVDAVSRAIAAGTAYEDHRPVLGSSAPNKFTAAQFSVEVKNPAAGLLRRRGVQQVDAVDQQTLDALAAEFRQAVGGEIADDAVYDALLNPAAPVHVRLPAAEVARRDPDRFLTAARLVLGTMDGWMTDDDIFNAVANPQLEMVASLKPKIQVVAVEDLQNPPAPYGGSALPPLNWRPAVKKRLVRGL